jgi:hypothetical protein
MHRITLTPAALALACTAGLSAPAAAQCPPSVPNGFTATRGTVCGLVSLNWNDINGASYYNVYRSSTNDWSSSTFQGITLTSSYVDDSAWSGYQYYYWVTATRTLCLPGSNTSGHSAFASGYIGDSPSTPVNVVAHDSCDGIRVSWELIHEEWLGAEPESFTIFRNTANNYAFSQQVGTCNGTYRSFVDPSVDENVEYFYWVRAENHCGTAHSGTTLLYPPYANSWTNTRHVPNETCSGAVLLQPPQPVGGNLECGTREGPVVCGSSPTLPDLWFRFNAPSAGTLHLDLCNGQIPQSFHPVAAVFDACPATAQSLVACDAGTPSGPCPLGYPRFDATLPAAGPYYIRVSAGSTGGVGDFTITSQFTAASQPCYANCDGSTVAPVLNVLDFNCFLSRFSAGQAYANCDGSTVAPVLNVLDFNCLL